MVTSAVPLVMLGGSGGDRTRRGGALAMLRPQKLPPLPTKGDTILVAVLATLRAILLRRARLLRGLL